MTVPLDQELALYMALDYRTVVVPDTCGDEGPCYVARHPELRGCMSHGGSVDEALANLHSVRALYLRTLLENGLRPPQPAPRPTATLGTAGQRPGPRQVVWTAVEPGSQPPRGLQAPSSPFVAEKGSGAPQDSAVPSGSMVPVS